MVCFVSSGKVEAAAKAATAQVERKETIAAKTACVGSDPRFFAKVFEIHFAFGEGVGVRFLHPNGHNRSAPRRAIVVTGPKHFRFAARARSGPLEDSTFISNSLGSWSGALPAKDTNSNRVVRFEIADVGGVFEGFEQAIFQFLYFFLVKFLGRSATHFSFRRLAVELTFGYFPL